ncbi:MAG: peptide chain release factor N(5)-glutamine methyltransferase [Candidatus Omnitrophica bacterium]|nr:peptide chain release factor N(5)-glutamine methyltransferase [Candidatus Omnitrophota bacterium]
MIDYSETVPVQYEKRRTRFMGMDIIVDERVLIPRPETELLVDVAVNFCRQKRTGEHYLLDMCTGSGAVALGIADMLEGVRITASDISSDAISVAGENRRVFGMEERILLVVSDLFDAFGREYEAAFDCIVSNPPYVSDKDYADLDAWVKAEPKVALYAGTEGMDYLNRIIPESEKYLSPGGLLAVEVGYDQAEKVKDLFKRCGYVSVSSFRDFNGYERVIAGNKDG